MALPAGLVGVYLIAAVLGALTPGPVQDVPRGAPGPKVLLISGPIHYDFLIPLTPETRTRFAPLAAHGVAVDDAAAQWLVLGWGARGFYTTTGQYSDIRLPVIWRSFTGDTSVLRVDTAGPLRADLPVRVLDLSEAGFSRFLDAVDDSFRTDAAGQPLPVPGPGLGPTDRFFEAQGRFDALRTCNTWVAKMIRAAGLEFGIWTPTPFAVTLSLNRFQSRQGDPDAE